MAGSTSGRPAGPGASADAPRFTRGSIMRHVVVMTSTGSVGLMSIFVVDVVNLFYISLLGQTELAAAVGYAGTLLFFLMSVSIGLSIGVTATVSRALGSGDKARARRLATAGAMLSFGTLAVLTAAVMPFQHDVLEILGAEGETLEIAHRFLLIVMPANAFMAAGMALGGVLRAAGDAKRGMYVTLGGAIVTAVLDPIFIFALDLGIDGAAIVTVISRFVIAGIGLAGAMGVHKLIARPDWSSLPADVKPVFAIALPAILTNLATPVGNAYVTAAMAAHGVEAVAAWAVIGRLFPLAFGGIFALSGSVGGIFGQNLGARLYDRVERTLRDSLIFTLVYVALVWAVLAAGSGLIADAFQATGDARGLIQFFCIAVAPTLVFTGALFVANAAFNNLGFATTSTAFNWGRSTIGVIPFCWIGSEIAGPYGVLLGWGLGGVVFGVAAVWVAFVYVRRIGAREMARGTEPVQPEVAAIGPFSTGKAGVAVPTAADPEGS